MPESLPPIPVESITSRIFLIRGQKVIIDSDLAELYGVTTKVFNQAVKRNKEKFPPDFVFQLTEKEKNEVSQIVTTFHISNFLLPCQMFLLSLGLLWPQRFSILPVRWK
jgi:hypothetical protein